MNIQVNTEHMGYVCREMYDISRQISKLLPELESVEMELKKQTQSGAAIRALRDAEDEISGEMYRLHVLAETLETVRNRYRRTEEKIEDHFEVQRPERIWLNTAGRDLSGIRSRMERLLYGGENGWR